MKDIRGGFQDNILRIIHLPAPLEKMFYLNFLMGFESVIISVHQFLQSRNKEE